MYSLYLPYIPQRYLPGIAVFVFRPAVHAFYRRFGTFLAFKKVESAGENP